MHFRDATKMVKLGSNGKREKLAKQTKPLPSGQSNDPNKEKSV